MLFYRDRKGLTRHAPIAFAGSCFYPVSELTPLEYVQLDPCQSHEEGALNPAQDSGGGLGLAVSQWPDPTNFCLDAAGRRLGIHILFPVGVLLFIQLEVPQCVVDPLPTALMPNSNKGSEQRLQGLSTRRWSRGRGRHASHVPWQQSPAQVVTTMRVKKKSFGFWKSFVRVYVRMMPQHTDSPVPGELKPYQLVKTILGWRRGGDHWTVFAERERLDEYDALRAEWVLLLTFLQPVDPNVRLGYKGSAEHLSLPVFAQDQAHHPCTYLTLAAPCASVRDGKASLFVRFTGAAPSLPPLPSAQIPRDSAVPADGVVPALVFLYIYMRSLARVPWILGWLAPTCFLHQSLVPGL